jgi:hypothetical protein
VLARARVPALRRRASPPDLARESGRVADEQFNTDKRRAGAPSTAPHGGPTTELNGPAATQGVMPLGGGGADGQN